MGQAWPWPLAPGPGPGPWPLALALARPILGNRTNENVPHEIFFIALAVWVVNSDSSEHILAEKIRP